jgi:hypothetical protein
MVNTVQQPPPPKISILPNLWVIIPIVAVVVAILSANLLLLNYIHVFTAILWTGNNEIGINANNLEFFRKPLAICMSELLVCRFILYSLVAIKTNFFHKPA